MKGQKERTWIVSNKNSKKHQLPLKRKFFFFFRKKKKQIIQIKINHLFIKVDKDKQAFLEDKTTNIKESLEIESRINTILSFEMRKRMQSSGSSMKTKINIFFVLKLFRELPIALWENGFLSKYQQTRLYKNLLTHPRAHILFTSEDKA